VAVPVTGGAGFSAINLDEDSEDEVLAHSLRFSAEQIEAHHAAKILLDAEEALLGAAVRLACSAPFAAVRQGHDPGTFTSDLHAKQRASPMLQR